MPEDASKLKSQTFEEPNMQKVADNIALGTSDQETQLTYF